MTWVRPSSCTSSTSRMRSKADRTLQQDALAGMTVALLFEKASTGPVLARWDRAAWRASAHACRHADPQLGRGETIETTRVNPIALRGRDRPATFEQERLEVLAEAATVPRDQLPLRL